MTNRNDRDPSTRPRRLTFTIALDERDVMQRELLRQHDAMPRGTARTDWIKRQLIVGVAVGACLEAPALAALVRGAMERSDGVERKNGVGGCP